MLKQIVYSLFVLNLVFWGFNCHEDDFNWDDIRNVGCKPEDSWRHFGLSELRSKGLSNEVLVQATVCLSWEIYRNTWNGQRRPLHGWITRMEFDNCIKSSIPSGMTLSISEENFLIACSISLAPHDVESSFCNEVN